MKIDRVIVIKRLRDAGVTWVVLAKGFQISRTRVRQIYFNNKTSLPMVSFLASKNAEFTNPHFQSII